MKKITTLLVFLFLSTALFSQLRLGVDGALGYSNGTVPNGDIYISVGPGGSSGESRDSFDKQGAFRFGVYGEYLTSEYIGVQLGVKYADYGFDLGSTSVDIDYIDVDVFVDFYPFSNFFLNIGATPSFLIKSPEEADFETFDVRIGGRLAMPSFQNINFILC